MLTPQHHHFKLFQSDTGNIIARKEGSSKLFVVLIESGRFMLNDKVENHPQALGLTYNLPLLAECSGTLRDAVKHAQELAKQSRPQFQHLWKGKQSPTVPPIQQPPTKAPLSFKSPLTIDGKPTKRRVLHRLQKAIATSHAELSAALRYAAELQGPLQQAKELSKTLWQMHRHCAALQAPTEPQASPQP